MKSRYFKYLCGLIRPSENYHDLLTTLHDFDFEGFVANDNNRSVDGLKIREQFCDEFGVDDMELLPGKCTVLEMLIALSYRLEFETAQSRWEKTPSQWFWILIDNLRLSDYNDRVFDPMIERVVEDKIRKLVDRTYDINGDGGLFPLNYTRHDQRTVEIWYQMTEYILENYPI